MDLSSVPTEDLLAYKQGRLQDVSTESLMALKNFKGQPKQKEQTKTKLGKTLFDQSMQGATFGFSDEITNPLGAVVAGLMKEPSSLITGEVTDPALSEELANASKTTNQQLSQQMQERPVASIGANIAGSLLTGAAGASTKVGAQMGNMLRSGNLGARIAKGVGTGAALGGLYGAGSAEEGKRTQGARQGAILGGAVGGAAPALGAAIKVVTPKIDEAYSGVANLAQKYKIPVSLDQVTGSRAIKNMQKVSQELPFSGQQGFREKQMKAFNSALFKTVGLDADKFTRLNVDKAFLEVGRKFDNFGKGKTFDANPLSQGIQEILNDAPSFATKDAIGILNSNVKKVVSEVQQGKVSGEKLNLLRSRINAAARKTNLPDAQELLKDLENVVIETLAQGDEEAIKQAKHQYKNLLVLEPLAAKSKAGNISPTELTSRVSRIYGRQFVRGKAGEIGELADIGRELLPELGGSDTTQKMAYMAASGAGILNPSTMVPVASGLAANRAAQSLVNRNQTLVSSLTRQQQKQLMSLPPADANKFIEGLKFSLPQSVAATQGQKR